MELAEKHLHHSASRRILGLRDVQQFAQLSSDYTRSSCIQEYLPLLGKQVCVQCYHAMTKFTVGQFWEVDGKTPPHRHKQPAMVHLFATYCQS